MITIGKITGFHGIKGDVKVYPLTDYPERYMSMESVLIGDESNYSNYEIAKVSKHKNNYLFKFKNINSIEDAEILKNKLLFVNEKYAVALPEDTFFIHDIIGIEVYRADKTFIGKVKNVISTGSNDVYVVQSQEKEVLIPALKAIITIDALERKITVGDLPGLFDGAEEA